MSCNEMPNGGGNLGSYLAIELYGDENFAIDINIGDVIGGELKENPAYMDIDATGRPSCTVRNLEFYLYGKFLGHTGSW